VTAFIRSVDREPAPIRVFYGARDRETQGLMPIWELTPFVELVDWAQGMRMFLRTGRAADMAEPTIRLGRELNRRWAETKQGARPNLGRLGKALQDFGVNLETLRTGDLLLGSAGSAAQLGAVLEKAKESAAAIPPLAYVLDRIRQDMVEPLLGASGHLANEAGHRALAGLARLYLDMGRWAEAVAVVREGWITRHATPAAAFGERSPHGLGVDDLERARAEESWKAERTGRDLAEARNDIEHAGFRSRPLPAAALQSRIGKLVEEFTSVVPPVAQVQPAGDPPVFVNLSNHPSGEWSAAQRLAAIELAPEIGDWPFPEVPPEADPADVTTLADNVVVRLFCEIPGTTHAMVQGEFTLAFEIVRRLQARGVTCLAATTERVVAEADEGRKTSTFRFVRFRAYPSLVGSA
jgi:CRISPR-associated protein Csx16